MFSATIFRLRPRVELMEDRTLLSTFLVNNTGDSGPGSLRQAILDSNAAIGATNTIDFAIPGDGVQTIAPLSPLPSITDPVLIDGFSQPSYSGTPLIELSGSQSGGGDGLLITAPNVTVRGLDIDSFSQGAGIHLTGTGATGDWIDGNFLGTDPTGTQAEPNVVGVEIDGGASNNLIGTNGDGVNDAAERNMLSGNFGAAGNVAGGVAVLAGASDNVIGGTVPGSANVISANSADGVYISDLGTTGNVVEGDEIGTDVTGTIPLGNGYWGVEIVEAADNTVGGPTPGARNVISGNDEGGVAIHGIDSVGDVVQGNLIGTDVTGTKALGTPTAASTSAIGGTPGTRPRTPPSAGRPPGPATSSRPTGTRASGSPATGTTGVLVQGNKIGTDVTGTIALGNGYWGVSLQEAADNTVGGPTAGAGNVISGNYEGGVAIHGIDSVGDVVQGNLIGTDVTGTQALGNAYSGVYVGDWGNSGDAASDATIGGTATGAGNVISANGNWGVWITGAGTTGVVVQGNLIGTDATGTVALGNAIAGVQIDTGALDNTIGGATAGAGNVISGNDEEGVEITGDGTTGNQVQGNKIGTDITGTVSSATPMPAFKSTPGLRITRSAVPRPGRAT